MSAVSRLIQTTNDRLEVSLGCSGMITAALVKAV